MTTGQLTAPVAPVPVPSSAQVRELLQTLMSAAVEVAPAAPLLPGRETAAVGVYVTDAEVVGAVVAWEPSLAAALGGALGEVPAAEVEQAVAAGSLEGDLAENAAEVLNVLAAAFNGPGAPPLKLDRVHAVGEELPPQLAPVFRYVMCRIDLQLDVAGYGGGRLSVVAVG
jgi:hypothetical protein